MIVQTPSCSESSPTLLKSLKALFSQNLRNLKALMIHGLTFNGFIDAEFLGLIQGLNLELLHLQYCPRVPYFSFKFLKTLHLIFDRTSLTTSLLLPDHLQHLSVYLSGSDPEHQPGEDVKFAKISAENCKNLESM